MRQVERTEVESHHWPILEPVEGTRERPVALQKRVCLVGDRARVNLPLPAETVSRAHALFLSDGHDLYLRDLASLNHVFVNDEPVRETTLQEGDVLRIGPYAFRCQRAPAATAHDTVVHAPAAELKTPDDDIHFPLASRTTLLGSREDCDVKMAGARVSPAHAVIFELDARHHIRDLRSAGGTYVNGHKVGQAKLNPGDEIRIGDSKLVYEVAPFHEGSAGTATPHVDDTMAGVLAEEEALTARQAARSENPEHERVVPVAEPSPAPPPDDLDVIPLMDDASGLKSIAEEYAAEKEGSGGPIGFVPIEPAGSAAVSDSDSIIPLLDESEFAPGLAPEALTDPALVDSASSPIPLMSDDSAVPLRPAPTPQPQPRDVRGEAPAAQQPGRQQKAKRNDVGAPRKNAARKTGK